MFGGRMEGPLTTSVAVLLVFVPGTLVEVTLTVSTHVVLAGTKPLVRRTICVSTAAVIVPVQPAGVNVTPAGLATRRRPSWGGATVRGGRLSVKVTPNW